MLEWLTPAERRGAAAVVVMLLLGAGYDAWRAREMRLTLARNAATHPARSENLMATVTPAASPERPEQPRSRLDLNRASTADLERLPGIGPVLAARIVAHRGRQGGFRRAEELLGVRGIGPRLFSRLAPLVSAAETSAAAIRSIAGPRPSGFVHSAQSGRARRADSTSVSSTPSR